MLLDDLKEHVLYVEGLREEIGRLNMQIAELRVEVARKVEPLTEREKTIERIIAYSEYAEKLRIPYKFGAEWINDKAFDCSSFTLNLFLHGANMNIPRGAGAQSKIGTEVKYEDLQRGDLVFFDVNGGTPNAGHVGIYLGDGTFRHTNVPSAGIHVNKMSDWKKRFITARRIL